jgi:hypothetical protein
LAIRNSHRSYILSLLLAQPLPNGDWLLAESRLAHSQATNADIYDRRARKKSSIRLGDGIERLQTAGDGCIWLSYFDEGVFSGGEPEHSGLACFDLSGSVLFRYWENVAEPNALPPIDDCYAINLTIPGFQLLNCDLRSGARVG